MAVCITGTAAHVPSGSGVGTYLDEASARKGAYDVAWSLGGFAPAEALFFYGGVVVALVLWIICGALMALFEKKSLEFMPWQSAALVHDFIAIATIPFFYYSYRADIRLRDISARGLGWAVAASVTGLVAYFAYYAALRSYDASKLGAYGLTEVAVLCVLCAVFLNESMTLVKMSAIILMIIGAWLLNK